MFDVETATTPMRALAGVFLCALILPGCGDDVTGIVQPGAPELLLPRTIDLGSLRIISAISPPPPASPDGHAFSVSLGYENRSTASYTLPFEITALRFYAGGEVVLESATGFPAESVPIRADHEASIIGMSFYPRFFLDQGLPAGLYFVSMLIRINGVPREMGIGHAVVAPDNGFESGGVAGPREIVVTVEARRSTGAPMTGAGILTTVHWLDCDRGPVSLFSDFLTAQGSFVVEDDLGEVLLPRACVSVAVTPFGENTPPQEERALLDFTHATRDSVHFEFVFPG